MRSLVRAAVLVWALVSAAGTARVAQPAPGAHAEEQGGPLIQDDAVKRMLMEGPRGSVAITVVQGTKAGTPVGELDLRVDLYHRNDPIYEMLATTDQGGVVLMGDLPVALPVRPVVRAEYGGVSYLEIGPPMSAESPDAVVKLTVYDTTDEAPAWRVAMRHVMVTGVDGGYVVEETLVADNPGDRTWLGGEPDERENRTTVRAELPQGATEIELTSGFHGWCCTKHEGRELAVQMPLMPGQTTYRFAYFVPSDGESAELRFAAPARTESMVLFVPDDGSTVEPASLISGGLQTVEHERMRMYQGQGIEAGTEAGLRLAAGRAARSRPAGGSGGVGAVPVIVGGVAALGVLGFLAARMKRAKVS